ncbi:unnamed protein product, partial [Strongylus vulgaris]
SPAIQTRALLDGTASCTLEGHALILSPNSAYFCNKATPTMLAELRFDNLHNMASTKSRAQRKKPQTVLLMPNIFASAARAHHHMQGAVHPHHHEHHEHHHHAAHPYHPHHRHHVSSDLPFSPYYSATISSYSPPRPYRFYSEYLRFQLEEDVEEIVNQIMEEIVVESQKEPKEPQFAALKEKEKKKICKYRKSCYETGVKPVIDDDWFFYPSHWWPSKEQAAEETEGEEAQIEEGEEDLLEKKFRCKYRLSCYHEKGIPLTEREAEKERRTILASKQKVQPGKKKTLKEIAAQTLQDVQEAAEKAARRPAIKVVETKLTATQEKLNEKLNCKYRKSCYETGQKPVIEEGWKLPIPIHIFTTESAETVSKQINYSELKDLEKKVFCKYRKSCYETGVKPEIEPEIFIQTLIDLTTLHEQVETRKLTLQEKCKYRKSCYETGIIPEINPKLEAVIQKEVSE